MIESLDETLKLKHVQCTSLQKAEDLGESMGGATYHILIKKMKNKYRIELVYHLPQTECMFCAMDDQSNEPFIWIGKK